MIPSHSGQKGRFNYVVSTDRLNPQPGETLSDIRLILGTTGGDSGRVIDRRSGQPVAGAGQCRASGGVIG